MNKKEICSIVRIVEMGVAITVLRKTYQIGLLGCLMVLLTGFVWAITVIIEDDEL